MLGSQAPLPRLLRGASEMAALQLRLAEPRNTVYLRQAIANPQPAKTRSIIFDLDGVLVDSKKAAAVALWEVANKEGVRAGRREI